jgi:preprotein translocase subunit SecG
MKKIRALVAIVLATLVVLQSCKKDSTTNSSGSGDNGNTENSGTIVAGTDPAVAGTQGFFPG